MTELFFFFLLIHPPVSALILLHFPIFFVLHPNANILSSGFEKLFFVELLVLVAFSGYGFGHPLVPSRFFSVAFKRCSHLPHAHITLLLNIEIVMHILWIFYVENQAIDRVHRIGQQKEVTVHRLVVADTVEDRILELQKSKVGVSVANFPLRSVSAVRPVKLFPKNPHETKLSFVRQTYFVV